MKLTLHALGILAVGLSSCQYVPGTDASHEREVREALDRTLHDAPAARFKDIRVIAGRRDGEPKLLCGLVNAKNRLGAYVGWHRFLVERGTDFAVVSVDADKNSSDADIAHQAGFDAAYPKEACPA